ncbi:hypothetical protein C1280_08155 [Gemmata obscuriglobus]|uniref:Uncharacterized protein n=1 Tax=Gemmata obscuriglobus TaxID=114 RepID=A0A2Z3H1I8_9BACT|nr:hypothetical protein C1280_08155 [Gemmata obscuriglobus]
MFMVMLTRLVVPLGMPVRLVAGLVRSLAFFRHWTGLFDGGQFGDRSVNDALGLDLHARRLNGCRFGGGRLLCWCFSCGGFLCSFATCHGRILSLG